MIVQLCPIIAGLDAVDSRGQDSQHMQSMPATQHLPSTNGPGRRWIVQLEGLGQSALGAEHL